MRALVMILRTCLFLAYSFNCPFVFANMLQTNYLDPFSCTDGSDNAPAINFMLKSSISVTLNNGRCPIKSSIILPSNHHLSGRGRTNTQIVVDDKFEKAQKGIIVCLGSEPGCIVDDLGIIFSQPDTDIRHELIDYPPALFLENIPRSHIERIRISGARVGIDAIGNTGGLFIQDLEISCFDRYIVLDGALDTVTLENIHMWPFDLTKKQMTISSDENVIGISSGRVDGLFLSNIFAYNVFNAVKLFDSQLYQGGTFGVGSNIGFDNNSYLQCDGSSSLNLSSVYWTLGEANSKALEADGCDISLSSFSIFTAKTQILPLISIRNSKGNARLGVTNGRISFSSGSRSLFFVDSLVNHVPTMLDISNTRFIDLSTSNHPFAIINVQGDWFGSISNNQLQTNSNNVEFIHIALKTKSSVINNLIGH